MFCEKCGAQIPDGGDVMCANCRARFGSEGQNFGQPVQPVQPNYGQPVQPNYGQPVQPVQPMGQPVQQNFGQPYQQPGAQKSGFSLNTITGNPMIMMIIRLALGAISLWAAFGPLLKFIGNSLVSFSFMEMNSMAKLILGSKGAAQMAGYFVPLLIMMILAILLALAGIALTILPKVAPQVKLPLPSYASYGATAGALVLAIISDFITIGFVATSGSPFSGFGVFMMILSFLALGATVFLALPELKKK